ncbi:ORF31 [Betabaculovirus altermyunipunctae]|uniref:ORF31 n=1 Tax=Betabaculovirus altermyunipunctae TaxID=3051996 RepID=A0A1S5YEC5_9BBAC|nr:ORF31 [Betabaculovirus altermyunipunctae]AQQ80298.1 ORF31 [Betabaculovirus altermyunipunctae]
MPEAYLINTLFNDILKFPWPVMLEVDSLRLWYSISSVADQFDVRPVPQELLKPYDYFTSVAVLDDENPFESDVNTHSFIDYNTLHRLHVNHCDVMDSNLHTIIDLFVYDHLPKFVSRHLANLRLITLFDVSDFADALRRLEMTNKYWLFRYKIVTTFNSKTTGKPEEEGAASAQGEEGVSVNETTTNNNNNSQFNVYIDSLKNNVELQFKQLHNYPEDARLCTLHAFVQLTTGTVGLLERLLDWN